MSTGLIDGAMDLLADHCVVETGTSGMWTYRKWSDGTAECWGNNHWTVTLTSVATYYHRGKISDVALPTGLFTSVKAAVALHTSGTPWVSIEGINATKISNIHVYDVVNTTEACYISFYIVGTWK